MSGNTIGDILKSASKEVKQTVNEVAIFKQLIKERVHPLDLIRELLSNAGAQEVGASEIEISYTKDKEGHIFEIMDNGCGMQYTGDEHFPGRLDRFLGLGLSGIIGMKTDEFSWKGLGSKLAYQSRRLELETCSYGNSFYDVRINEPWETLDKQNKVPRPRLNEHPSQNCGTKIRVIGHPPHRHDETFSFEMIRSFLLHRTFAGYTRERKSEPKITLSVLGRTEHLPFGFPEFRLIDFDDFAHAGLKLDVQGKTLFINMQPKSTDSMRVTVKGLITWDAEKYDLTKTNLNTGLILSVKGIPYFTLNMEDYGVRTIRTARPGEQGTCLVVECDGIQDEMNISRSGLVDSPKSLELKKVVTQIFERIESSKEFLEFRRIPEQQRIEKHGDTLADEKLQIEQQDQNWVVLDRGGTDLTVLIREPKNEEEVNALIWKLEALKALPFARFTTLAYIGAAKGPDILAHFQEEKGSEPFRSTVIEVENNFYNYKTHGHTPSQYPKVFCWEIPASGRKAKINKTQKPYKFTVNTDEFQVHVFVLKHMEGVKVLSRQELKDRGVEI